MVSMSYCFSRRIKGVRVYSFDEIRESVLEAFLRGRSSSRYSRDSLERAKARYLAKIRSAYNKFSSMISGCADLPRSNDIHPFYRDLINSFYEGKYDEILEKCRSVASISRRLYNIYRDSIRRASASNDIRRLSREFIGRILSTARRKLRDIDLLKKILIEISKMPCIEEEVLKVILSGMPQTGKSTLLSSLSRARPEISNYPFTTKNIIAGHYIDESSGIRIMFIDTPGLLDRPVEEMNQIELRAVHSLKHLADKIVFLLDPRKNFYYTLEQQLRVLDTVREISGKRDIIICINKIDIAGEDEISEVERKILERGFSKDFILRISALKKLGLEDLIRRVLEQH
ncbi:MAG: GTPase [Sulfolobales archaeon]